MKSTLLLTGLGLRAPHYQEVLERRPAVAWFEVHSENFFGEGGKALQTLLEIRQLYPISLHGVGLSLGSADELNWQYLKKLKSLIERVQPALVSDHLSWSSIHGQYFHDLLPLPYTEETLQHLCDRIDQIQHYLKRQILLENISRYLTYEHATFTEQDFLVALVKQSGCGLLLDVNNVYVSAANLQFDAQKYIQKLPPHAIQEIHLGGFSRRQIANREVLIDSHDQPIVPAVWDLYRYAIQQVGRKPTIIEWDANLPALETLYLQAFRAEKIMRETYAIAKLTG